MKETHFKRMLDKSTQFELLSATLHEADDAVSQCRKYKVVTFAYKKALKWE